MGEYREGKRDGAEGVSWIVKCFESQKRSTVIYAHSLLIRNTHTNYFRRAQADLPPNP